MSFCLLDSDQKTFECFKSYVEHLERNKGSCFDLDNQIQANEIRKHLLVNGISSDDANEKIDWIRRNGKPFREYLNTIKLAYVVWKCSGLPWESVRWEDFIRITKQINELKPVCLDTIF